MRTVSLIAPLTITLLLSLTVLSGYSGNLHKPLPWHSLSIKYVGSINSDKYHYPNCRWVQKIKSGNEVWFSSREGAKKAGYVSCKVCKP